MRRITLDGMIKIIYPLIVVIFIFFKSFRLFAVGNINVTFLVLSVVLFGLWVIFCSEGLIITRQDIFLLLFAAYIVFDGLLRTKHKSEAFEYWSVLLAVIAFKFMLQNELEAVSVLIKQFKVSAAIMSAAIIFQGIFPSLMNIIQRVWFTPTGYAQAQYVAGMGYRTGLTSFSAAAVWCGFILFAFAVSYLVVSEKANKKFFIVLALSLFAMVLTQKRSVLIAAVIASLVLILIFGNKFNNRFIVVVSISLGIFILALLAYQFIPQVQTMWARTMREDRMLSGREDFWDVLVPMFRRSPVIGVGGGTCQYLFGFGGHNCYLQLLAEYGIIGLVLFLAAFGFPLVNAVIHARSFMRENKDPQLTYWLALSVIIQIVFFIYCFTGNPLFDYMFFMTDIIFIGISQSIISGKLTERTTL